MKAPSSGRLRRHRQITTRSPFFIDGRNYWLGCSAFLRWSASLPEFSPFSEPFELKASVPAPCEINLHLEAAVHGDLHWVKDAIVEQGGSRDDPNARTRVNTYFECERRRINWIFAPTPRMLLHAITCSVQVSERTWVVSLVLHTAVKTNTRAT